MRDETQKRKLVNMDSNSRLPSSSFHLRASHQFPLLFAVPGTHHCLVHRLPDTHPFFISCLPGGEGCARGGRTRRGDERGVWDLCRCSVVGPGESPLLKGNPGKVVWQLDWEIRREAKGRASAHSVSFILHSKVDDFHRQIYREETRSFYWWRRYLEQFCIELGETRAQNSLFAWFPGTWPR